MNLHDGENWHAITDADDNRIVMDRITTDGTTSYGLSANGVNQIDYRTNTWKPISLSVPYRATSLAVDGDMFYIGTAHNGVFRFQHGKH